MVQLGNTFLFPTQNTHIVNRDQMVTAVADFEKTCETINTLAKGKFIHVMLGMKINYSVKGISSLHLCNSVIV